jgi:hypothetical protein
MPFSLLSTFPTAHVYPTLSHAYDLAFAARRNSLKNEIVLFSGKQME